MMSAATLAAMLLILSFQFLASTLTACGEHEFAADSPE
jgi:hypothetical protein